MQSTLGFFYYIKEVENQPELEKNLFAKVLPNDAFDGYNSSSAAEVASSKRTKKLLKVLDDFLSSHSYETVSHQ